MAANFSLTIKKPNLNPYSKRQYGADVYCGCCGRGIPNRDTATVVVETKVQELGGGMRVIDFRPVTEWEDQYGPFLGRDSVEWGTFVGSHCAKQIPKEFKVTQKKVIKLWALAGYP